MKAVVVGAGIGGLAAGISLAQDDHEVVILERADRLGEIGAGIGLGPNAVACLERLGATSSLSAEAVRPLSWPRRRWTDGSLIADVSLEAVLDDFGFEFWTVHRGDLHGSLLDRARALGIEIRTSAEVNSVDVQIATAHTSLGAVTGDVLIGADGVRSVITEQMHPGTSAPRFTGDMAIRMQFDTELLKDDPRFAHWAQDQNITTWLGPGAHVVTMTIRGGTMMNFTFCISAEAMESGSSRPSSADELLPYLQGWYPDFALLAREASSLMRWDLYDRPPLDAWSQGRTVVIGDAAHAMMPYLGQGAAQALEDGVAIGDLLRGAGRDDVPKLLPDLWRTRHQRTDDVQRISRANRGLYHLPDGPDQEARDQNLASDAADRSKSAWLWGAGPGMEMKR